VKGPSLLAWAFSILNKNTWRLQNGECFYRDKGGERDLSYGKGPLPIPFTPFIPVNTTH